LFKQSHRAAAPHVVSVLPTTGPNFAASGPRPMPDSLPTERGAMMSSSEIAPRPPRRQMARALCDLTSAISGQSPLCRSSGELVVRQQDRDPARLVFGAARREPARALVAGSHSRALRGPRCVRNGADTQGQRLIVAGAVELPAGPRPCQDDVEVKPSAARRKAPAEI
jgi:hypothetical protein